MQPNTLIWLSGDYHTQNIGFFDDNAGTVVFDLNDSDDSYIGPFYWDLIRFSTSVYLMTTEMTAIGFSKVDQESLVSEFLKTYQDTLESRIEDVEMDDSYITSGFVRDKLRELKKTKTQVELLDKFTVVSSGVRVFEQNTPNLAATTYYERRNITYNWDKYIQTLSPSFVVSVGNSSYFAIKDIARRLDSGLGSQGVDKFYVLIEGRTSSQDDDELLEVKEEDLPSLFHEGSTSIDQYNSWFSTHAERYLTAKKATGIKLDKHYGSMNFMGKSFRIARISQYKFGFASTDFLKKSDVKDFVFYAAKALALAHARSDKEYDKKYIWYNFKQAYVNATAVLSQFKSHVNTLSEKYFHQVNDDYIMFVDLLKSGQFK